MILYSYLLIVYFDFSDKARLEPYTERMAVSGFRPVKAYKNVDKSGVSDIIKENGKATSKAINRNITKPNTSSNNSTTTVKTIGSESFTPEALTKLRQTERILIGNNYEKAVVYNQNGDKVFQKKGDRNSVAFTKKEISQMKGCVITHNHPNCSVFSPEDVNMLRKSGAAEIRAATQNGTYVLKPPKTWGSDISSLKNLDKEYNDCIDKYILKYKDKAAQEGKPLLAYLQKAEHDGSKEFFNKHGFEFKMEGLI